VCESNSLNTLRIHVAWILKTKFTNVNSDFGLVQFSRSTEAHPRVLRGWSLKTEQRTHQPEADEEPGRRSREISLERR
jgi:hypothetical protein